MALEAIDSERVRSAHDNKRNHRPEEIEEKEGEDKGWDEAVGGCLGGTCSGGGGGGGGLSLSFTQLEDKETQTRPWSHPLYFTLTISCLCWSDVMGQLGMSRPLPLNSPHLSSLFRLTTQLQSLAARWDLDSQWSTYRIQNYSQED